MLKLHYFCNETKKNIEMKTISFLFLSIFILSSTPLFGQKGYTIVSNEAEIPRFELGFNPFEFYSSRGINAGIGVNVKMRPINRIGIDGRFRSMVYTNPYRQEFDGPDSEKSGLKSTGGIGAAVVGEFVWRRKGMIFLGKGGGAIDKFILSRTTSTELLTTTTETRYLPMKFNTLVERTLRGGIIYDNYPMIDNVRSSVAFAAGIGKRNSSSVTIDIQGVQQSQSTFFQYGFEILYGFAQFEDASLEDGPISGGFRIFLERQWKAKNATQVRGWKNFEFTIEAGSRPGGIAYFGITAGIPAFSIGKTNVSDDKTYKEVNAPKRFIGRFLRFI